MNQNPDQNDVMGLVGSAWVRTARIAILASLLFLTGRVAATTSVAFSGPTAYSVGSNPVAVVTGDFNSDGKSDLAVANSGSNDVSILLGNGDGTFQSAMNYAVEDPVSIAVEDFNGDHRLDLAVASGSSNQVSVLLGNGEGSFQPALHYNTGAEYIVAADFNGDHKPDLLLSGGGVISTLLGTGDGTFQAAISSPGGGTDFVAVADFNGDGRMDVATGTGMANGESDTGKLLILLGNGDGTFQTAISSSLSFWPQYFIAADFNGDGKIDLAAAVRENIFGGDIRVFLGHGDGTFSASTSVKGTFASFVAVGDLNSDGRPDLIGLEHVGPQNLPMEVQWMLGNGDGTFQDSAFNPCSQTSGCLQIFLLPSWLAIGNFNGGNFLVTTNPLDNSISVFQGENGGPGFSLAASSLTPGSVTAGQSASATVTINPIGAFSGSINFACSVQPSPADAPTCSVNPPISSSGTALIVNTAARTSAKAAFSLKLFYALTLPLAGPLLIAIGRRPGKDRNAKPHLYLFCAIAVLGWLCQSGCDGSHTSSNNVGTPSGMYTITVSGTSGSIQHSATLTLTVQ